VLSEDQVKLLLGDLKENHTELFFHVALAVHTLARAGELRALTWADIDFSTRLINISKTRDPKTGLKLSTKGNEIRKVWINDELMELLKELKQTTFSASSDQVLPHWREFAQNEQGKPLKIFCQRLGLPLIRFHDLRASGITILLNRGVPLPQVMKLAMDSKINSLFASS
jgi:integrase